MKLMVIKGLPLCPLTKCSWDMGMASFCQFFQKLSCMETRSLQPTKEVLEEREQLQALMQISGKTTQEIRNAQQILKRLDEIGLPRSPQWCWVHWPAHPVQGKQWIRGILHRIQCLRTVRKHAELLSNLKDGELFASEARRLTDRLVNTEADNARWLKTAKAIWGFCIVMHGVTYVNSHTIVINLRMCYVQFNIKLSVFWHFSYRFGVNTLDFDCMHTIILFMD